MGLYQAQFFWQAQGFPKPAVKRGQKASLKSDKFNRITSLPALFYLKREGGATSGRREHHAQDEEDQRLSGRPVHDRERRDYETLGAYGVIDAELYTGHLEVDRGALEYDDAETMEQAIEQARGLESELDVEEPEAAVTVIVETELGTTELETTPEELLQGEKRFLETRRPALSQEAADWQLCGYVRALTDLGIVDSADERFQVTSPPTISEPPEASGTFRPE